MDDLVEQMLTKATVLADMTKPCWDADVANLLMQGANEIKQMRAEVILLKEVNKFKEIAGAVTPGKSFAEISDEIAARVIKHTHG